MRCGVQSRRRRGRGSVSSERAARQQEAPTVPLLYGVYRAGPITHQTVSVLEASLEGNAPGWQRWPEPLTIKTGIFDTVPWSVQTKIRHTSPCRGRRSYTVQSSNMCSWDKILSLENTSFTQLLGENAAMHHRLQPVFPD